MIEICPELDVFCLWTTVNAGPSCLFLLAYVDALSCSAMRSPGDRGCGGETDLNRAMDGSVGGRALATCAGAASGSAAPDRYSPPLAPAWSEPGAC